MKSLSGKRMKPVPWRKIVVRYADVCFRHRKGRGSFEVVSSNVSCVLCQRALGVRGNSSNASACLCTGCYSYSDVGLRAFVHRGIIGLTGYWRIFLQFPNFR